MFLIIIFDKVVLENGGTLKSFSDCYKSHTKVFDKNYPHVLEFVPECYKTQKMCDKVVDTNLSTIKYVRDQYKKQEMYNKIASDDAFKLKYCRDRCKTQEMSNDE